MQIILDLPDNLSPTATFNQSDWLREIAVALFQQELVTLGTASQIAGMHQMEFQQLIGSRGICIHYNVEEFEEDVQSLRDRGWL
jgi:predicted HTH domain antitoxin